MKNLFLGLAVFALIACGGKNEDAPGAVAAGGSSAQPAAAPAAPPAAPAPLIPNSMRGTYSAVGNSNYKLAVSATGINFNGIFKGSLTMNAGRIDGTSYIVDGSQYSGSKLYGGSPNCRGSIDLQGENLSVTLTGNDGCGSVLSGSYVRAGKGGGDKRRSDDEYAKPVRDSDRIAAVKEKAIGEVAAVKAAVAPSAAAEAPSSAGGLGVGSRVSCNWKSLGTYYNGTIKRKNGSKVFIKYDDGDEENTRLSKCRALGGSSAGKGSSGGGGADTVRVNIKVKMKRTKDNGKNWDAFGGEPDIAICIDSDSGFQCYPDGDSVNGILSPECQDSFRCTFRNVPVPKDGFELIVVDVDLAANDVAGSEECRPRGTCNVGRAKATITRR